DSVPPAIDRVVERGGPRDRHHETAVVVVPNVVAMRIAVVALQHRSPKTRFFEAQLAPQPRLLTGNIRRFVDAQRANASSSPRMPRSASHSRNTRRTPTSLFVRTTLPSRRHGLSLLPSAQ